MLYLNLFDGSIILFMNQPLMLPPAYKNHLGQPWKIIEKEEDPKDFVFDLDGFSTNWKEFIAQIWGV